MCRIKNCKRHEYDYNLCLPHLKEAVAGVGIKGVYTWQPKHTRKKKVDAVEVVTTDADTLETR